MGAAASPPTNLTARATARRAACGRTAKPARNVPRELVVAGGTVLVVEAPALARGVPGRQQRRGRLGLRVPTRDTLARLDDAAWAATKNMPATPSSCSSGLNSKAPGGRAGALQGDQRQRDDDADVERADGARAPRDAAEAPRLWVDLRPRGASGSPQAFKGRGLGAATRPGAPRPMGLRGRH